MMLYLISEMCDFEATDLCGFTQRKDDKFDWTQGSARDMSGLLNDHTTGDVFGETLVILRSSLFSICGRGRVT